MKNQTKDNTPFFSGKHRIDPEWTTRIQIGRVRFNVLEKIIDYIILFFNPPKFTKSNLE